MNNFTSIYVCVLLLVLSIGFGYANADAVDIPAGIKIIAIYDKEPLSVAADKNGNIHVAGKEIRKIDSARRNQEAVDVFLEKYDTKGNKLWKSIYSSSEGDSLVRTIALDNVSDIYIVGDTGGGERKRDKPNSPQCYVVKVDQTGHERWSHRFGPSNNRFCVARSAVTDNNGSVIVSGFSDGRVDSKIRSVQENIIFIAKYSTDGVLTWQREYDTKELNYKLWSMALDKDGFIYLTGWYGIDGMFLVKLDDKGSKVWENNLKMSDITMTESIITDANNNVYVAGYTHGSVDQNAYSGGMDAFLIKFNANGNKLWSRMIGSTRDEILHTMKIDKLGHIWLIGSTEGYISGPDNRNGVNWDYFIAIYDDSGARLTLKQFGGSNNDMALDAALDNFGSLYIVGGYNNKPAMVKIPDISLMK